MTCPRKHAVRAVRLRHLPGPRVSCMHIKYGALHVGSSRSQGWVARVPTCQCLFLDIAFCGLLCAPQPVFSCLESQSTM